MKNLIICIFVILFGFKSMALGDSLSLKYPYARITPDYGILSEFDLKKSEDGVVAAELFDEVNIRSLSYPYWQCFPVRAIRYLCLDLHTKDGGESMADFRIQVAVAADRVDEYWGRRGIPIMECRKMVNEWKKLAKGEKYACIAGLYCGVDEKLEHTKKLRRKGWVYDRFKTKKGCTSYFGDRCESDFKMNSISKKEVKLK